jgi:uncharacterized membrane protein SirB2/RNA polymerase subunit RPABC4/transcription elongation factor Spt4
MADDKHEEEVTCPVCGGLVNLEVSSCPHCGAEFEEEGVEEIIQVDEEAAPAVITEEAVFEEIEVTAAEDEMEAEEVEVVRPSRARPARVPPARSRSPPAPASIADFRVLGAALAILGIIGAQISLLIDWYWGWVPPIEDNLGLFIAIPLVIIIVGIMLFMLVKKTQPSRKRAKSRVPGVSLTVFMVGVLALVLLAAYGPLNDALQDSKGLVAGVFVLLMVVGVVLYMMGSKSASRTRA